MALAAEFKKEILTEREKNFAGLNLPKEFIAPNYHGRSIVNVSASAIQILGGKIKTPPLDSAIIEEFAADVERVVLIVIDALGYQKLLDTLNANRQNGFHALVRNGARIVPLTSVFPSTTVAALTSLWTARTPAEHGFLGFQLFLREYGVRAQMIGFNPTATNELGGEQLVQSGLEPEKFLHTPSLPQILSDVRVPTYNLIEKPYVRTGLSRVQVRGARETRGFVTSSDMWVELRVLLEQIKSKPALIFVYWSGIDTIMHTFGASTQKITADINNLAYSFEREFLKPLTKQARRGTLLLMTSDHGAMDTPRERAIYLREHRALREHLVMDFAGEPRAAYFYCRNGAVDAAREYVEKKLGDKFFVLDSQQALEGGLFGFYPFSREAKHRIGDLIILPRKNYTLWDRKEPPESLGRHGGLSQEEMLVPLLAARLDG